MLQQTVTAVLRWFEAGSWTWNTRTIRFFPTTVVIRGHASRSFKALYHLTDSRPIYVYIVCNFKVRSSGPARSADKLSSSVARRRRPWFSPVHQTPWCIYGFTLIKFMQFFSNVLAVAKISKTTVYQLFIMNTIVYKHMSY